MSLSLRKLAIAIAALIFVQAFCCRLTGLDTEISCPALATPTPAPETLTPLSIELHDYYAYTGGSFFFRARVVNNSEHWLEETRVQVTLFDALGVQVAEQSEECPHRLPSGDDCWIEINFPEGSTEGTDADVNYSLQASATTDEGKLLQAQLSDHPLTGQEGVLPVPQAEATWIVSPAGYQAGDEVEAQLSASLRKGLLADGQLCAQIIEFRQRGPEEIEPHVLTEVCPGRVELAALEYHDPYQFDVQFTPSGYTWVSNQDSSGPYTPVAYLACLAFDQQGAQASPPLYLPPVQVIEAWWEQGGERISQFQPDLPVTGYVRLLFLADDATPHKLKLTVMQHPSDIAGLGLIFPPALICYSDVCDPVYKSQKFDVTLVKDQTSEYNLEVQITPEDIPFPNKRYYLLLLFEGVEVWRDDFNLRQARP